MTTLTPELRLEIEKAGNAPVHLQDPVTNEQYVLLRADVYAMLRESLEHELLGDIPHGETEEGSGRNAEDLVRAMYPLVDRTFRAGWETPEMSEYDEYEKHRP